jgi:hypothetical protein
MGFGFVETSADTEASAAMAALNGSDLEDRALLEEFDREVVSRSFRSSTVFLYPPMWPISWEDGSRMGWPCQPVTPTTGTS